MPTSLDLPMIDTVIVECPNPGILSESGESARQASFLPLR